MLKTRRRASGNGRGSGELRRLRGRLAEAEETLDAIRKGEVDAITVEGPHGRQIFTLQSADLPYRTLVERMNEGAASMSAEGVILFCNERLAEMLETRPEKLIGRSIGDLVVSTEKEAMGKLLARGLGDEARGEVSLQSDEGTIVPALVSLKATPGEAQEEVGVCLIATDLSERRRTEVIAAAEREKFNRILDNLPPYVVLLTPDYHVAFANREFRQRFGESHGRRCYEFLFERSEPCEVCNTYEVLKTGGPMNWKWTGPDGRNYDIYDFPFTDTDGSRLILEMGIDVTEQRRAEEELRNASAYARNLIEASLDPLVTISSEGKVTDVNQATEGATGLSREELIGSEFCEYFTEPEKARQGYRQAFEQGCVRDYPLAIRHASGRITDVLYNATVYRNEAGEVQGVFAAARDITERKRAEQTLHQQAALLDLAQDAIIVRDSDARIVFWNRGASDTYGYPVEEAKGKKSHELLKTVFPMPLEEIESLVGTAREWEGELRHTRKDGREIAVASRWSLLRDERGKPTAIMEINRDISVRKRAEEALERSNEELAQFAYVASHDLQEPLRKIVAFGDRLVDHSSAVLDEQGRDYLGRMQNAAKRMAQLIESLLELSRVTTKGAEFVGVDLNAVLSEVLTDLEVRIQQTQGQVEVGALPTVMADRSQMRQLFQNLIGNALKFHREDVPPVIQVSGQQKAGKWEIHVTDNGIGFDEKYTDRIFRPFQRLHGKNVFEGSGMGLAICSKIMARHAGQITAHSQPGKGSDFVLTLPATSKTREASAT